MPRVHTVKSARKDHPQCGVKKGERYYWWKHRMKGARSGFMRCSKTYPRQSQLTMSEFWGDVYTLQEQIEDYGQPEDRDDLIVAQEGWAEEARGIGSAQEDKLNAMPDGLQEGDVGQMLQERADACGTWADEIEAVTIPERGEYDTDEDYAQGLQDALDEIAALQPECS